MNKGMGMALGRVLLVGALLSGFRPVLAEDLVYTFRPGDSLWKVCEQYARDPHICWQELAQRNGIASPRAIPAGARLRIPSEWLKLQPQPALIDSARGEVLVYRKEGGEPEFAGDDTEIHLGDALETGPDGYARVEFADQSWLEFSADSLVVFDRFSRFRDSGMVATSLRLERGRIRTWVRPRRSERQHFMITTPSAAAAVRGTEFDLSVDGNDTLRNEVLSGEVAVEAEGVSRTVPSGFAVLARAGEPPSEPVQLLPAPTLTVDAVSGEASVQWPAVDGAQGYRVSLYEQAGGALIREDRTEQLGWRTDLEPGYYRVLGRAEDGQGLRGQEAELGVTVVAEPVPAAEPEQPDSGLLLFILGAGVLLLL